MQVLRMVALTLMMSFAAAAHAQRYQCGSDISQYFVPDRPLGFTFLPACENHDRCYERCEGAADELKAHGQGCDQAAAAKESRRAACDDRFHQALVRACLNRYFTTTCETLAKIYTVGVRLGGKGSFNGREITELVRVLQAEPSYDVAALHRALDQAIREGRDLSGQKIALDIRDAGVRATFSNAFQPRRGESGRLFTPLEPEMMKLDAAEIRRRIHRFNVESLKDEGKNFPDVPRNLP